MLTMRRIDAADKSSLDQWQIEEIEKALGEAERGEFASSKEVQRTIKKLIRPAR